MNNENLLGLALNLTSAMQSNDRYQVLLKHVLELIPCDAACLLEKRDGNYSVLAYKGLVPSIENQIFCLKDHPRLEAIVTSKKPTVFPHNSDLPDPFDNLIDNKNIQHLDVHSCLGCPLIVNNEVVGILTVDSLKPHQFDDLRIETLQFIGAMAGATLQTAKLIEETEQKAKDSLEFSRRLLKEANSKYTAPLLGVSEEIENIKKHIQIVSASDFPVLIQGDTGVGKEVVARSVHYNSQRASKSLIYVNCAALPESIAESELFGHTRGAFTGASSDRMGKFQLAHEGTLFLDEIGELPLSIQPKLLRAIQEGEIQRVGSDKIIKVDVRIISATNRNLLKEIEEKHFRADLYHRLGGYPLYVPTLKNRKEDIPVLISYFKDIYSRKLNTKPVRIDKEAMALFQQYDWPGNVRELKNTLSRAILKAHHDRGFETHSPHLNIKTNDIKSYLPTNGNKPSLKLDKTLSDNDITTLSFRDAVKDFEKKLIQKTYDNADHNWSKAAQILRMHRSNLYNLAKKLEII
ncbi:MAG: nitric oxide reductase transcriptional regulator NorR [Deltaproteobacteria bacterium]|nr:nitric oxide reductase transcriptional regulator NorR [Deltaproteobacteria bacterium]